MTGEDRREGLDLGLPPVGVAVDEVDAGRGDGLSWSWKLDVESSHCSPPDHPSRAREPGDAVSTWRNLDARRVPAIQPS